MQKYTVLIVVYGRSIEDLPFWSMHSTRGIDWLCLDNSPDAALRKHNRAQCINSSLHYLDMQGNAGLSKAYNAARRYLLAQPTPPEWVILLDQDTEGIGEFLQAFSRLSSSVSPIFVPAVIANKRQLSPRYFSKDLLRQTEEAEFSGARQCAINSGMAIALDFWRQMGRYDEALFLDCVDYDFLLRAYQKFPRLSLGRLPAILQQNFSGDSRSTYSRRRFRNYQKDLRYFARKHGIPFFKVNWLLLKCAAALCRSQHTVSFLLDFLWVAFKSP